MTATPRTRLCWLWMVIATISCWPVTVSASDRRHHVGRFASQRVTLDASTSRHRVVRTTVDQQLPAGSISETPYKDVTVIRLHSIRGGSVMTSVVVSCRSALIRNPLLILLMMTSSALVVYKDQVPYVKHVQGLVQFGIVCYVFYMLVQWQRNVDRDES